LSSSPPTTPPLTLDSIDAGVALVEEKENPDSKDLLEDRLQEEAARLRNRSFAQDMGERLRYANHAYGITQAWVGFLIVITICQFALKPFGYGLGQTEFVTVFTTTTASIFGFWLLVGRYLFPTKGKDD
jgi:hypothetical protein